MSRPDRPAASPGIAASAAQADQPMPWRDLRLHTTARVALGRVGNAQPTSAHLDFQEAHARARDAVWSALDADRLRASLAPLGLPVRQVASEAADRRAYLLRPDLGRRLRAEDRRSLAAGSCAGCFVMVVADGLCAAGIQAQAAPLVSCLAPALRGSGWELGPLVIATQARVALGDEVGEALGAAAVAVIIGERPGLSSLDSVGIYLTWAPRRGRTDAERNCISNIRPAGLAVAEAAANLAWLASAARRLGVSGVGLKDERTSLPTLGNAADPLDPLG